MSNNNPIDREAPNLFLEEVEDSPDVEFQEQPYRGTWNPDQLIDPESQITGEVSDEVSDKEEVDTGFDNDSLGKAKDPVFLYLQELGSAPLLSRDEEVKLAQRIEEGEAQIVAEALSSLLALRRALDLGKKVAAGLVNVRDVVSDPQETSADLLANEKILKARFRTQMRKLHCLARSYEQTVSSKNKRATRGLQKKLEEKRIRQREKIAAAINALQLNRGQIGFIVEDHKKAYEKLKELNRKIQEKTKERGIFLA